VGYSRQAGIWRWFPWVYHATADRTVDHRLHLGWPILLVGVLLAGWRRKDAGPWLTVVLLSVLLFWFSPSPRIYFPVMILAWLFLPGWLQSIHDSRRLRILAAVGLMLLLISSLPWIHYFLFMEDGQSPQDYLLGRIDDKGFLRKQKLLTPAIEWIHEHAPPGARIWAWGEESVFHIDRWVLANSYLDAPSFLKAIGRGGASGLDQTVRNRALHFILVSRINCPSPIGAVHTEAGTWKVPDHFQDELIQWMEDNLTVIVYDDEYLLYGPAQSPDRNMVR
jgi:hypothetical protein